MAGGELLHTTCLAADTLVAMADIEPNPVDGVAPPRVLPVSSLTAGMRLVGTGDPVTITQIDPVETTDVMYEMQHTDGTSYRVTADHTLTLRWCAGPHAVIQPPNAHETASGISMRWWIWQDGKLREGHIQERRCCLTTDAASEAGMHSGWTVADTWDEVRGKLWDEFNAEAAKPCSDASLALFAGDLIDVPVSALDDGTGVSAIWNALFADPGQIRATAAEVELPILECERAAIVAQADVAAAVAALPAGSVAANLEAAQHDVSIQLLGPRKHRSVVPGDRVNLVVQLSNKGDSTCSNLEGVFADIGVPLCEGSGVVITQTSLVADEAGEVDSRLPAYDDVCDAQMLFILDVLGASTIVSCSGDASFRWRGARHLPGVSNFVNRASDDGDVTLTTFEYAPAAVSSADKGCRTVTIYHTLHPCFANKEAIEQTILRALGLPSSRAPHRPHRRIASLKRIQQTNQKFRRFTVDGDRRFAMADGTVTHVSNTHVEGKRRRGQRSL